LAITLQQQELTKLQSEKRKRKYKKEVPCDKGYGINLKKI
jgi:hypothetical protein